VLYLPSITASETLSSRAVIWAPGRVQVYVVNVQNCAQMGKFNGEKRSLMASVRWSRNQPNNMLD
jgi:hypothetical protein